MASTLFISPMSPWPPTDGGRIRVREMATAAARVGPVTVVALEMDAIDTDAAVEAAQSDGVELRVVNVRAGSIRYLLSALAKRRSYYLTRYTRRALVDELLSLPPQDWRMIQVEFSFMDGYRDVVRGHPNFAGVPWILDEHNVEWLIAKQLGLRKTNSLRGMLLAAYRAREHRLRRSEELEACAKADGVVAVSEEDIQHLQAAVPSQSFWLVPNGVHADPERFLIPPIAPPRAVFVAKMDYAPNVDAATWFISEILPIVRERHPTFEIMVVGARPPRRLAASTTPGVTITGWVADARAVLRGATMAVVPLRAGSGTRLKVLEAMSVGRPVVSTAIGAEGLGLVPGVDYEQGNDSDSFAAAVCRVIEDADTRETLGSRGRVITRTKFSWEACTSAWLADVYRRHG